MNKSREDRRGLLIIFTGDGKGKTTAALGMAVRAMGYGYRTFMVQFIKGTWNYGELMQEDRFGDLLEVKSIGLGYVGIMGDTLPREKHAEAVKKGLELTREAMKSGNYDIIIMDEINIALQQEILELEELKKIINEKPPYLHLVMTGRGAPEDLIDMADLVTEMKKVKHPFDKGILAQKGVEF
jgi:cob(I)alamin adenosyltransferase